MSNKFRLTAGWAFMMLAVFLVTSVAGAQFGVGLRPEWSDFNDPSGRFALKVPPSWSYEAGPSTANFFVFYGPGTQDLFYVEILDPATGLATPMAQAQDAVARYSAPNGLRNFKLISPPSVGSLAGKESSFIVYSYNDSSGAAVVEGRAFVMHGGKVLTLAFADSAANFDASVPMFNQVMASLQLVEAAPSGTGFGFGSTPTPQPQPAPAPGPALPGTYTSPGSLYRFAVPADWELWEEQATARGDKIEPWNGVFNWSGRPMTKSLFIWDFFDEWEQKGAQHEIVLAVIENVPGTQTDAIETLKNNVVGSASAGTYTTTSTRVRIGTQTAMAVQIVTRPGMVELWSAGPVWHKTVTFFVFKQANTFFAWVVPNEVADHPTILKAMDSFQWMGR